VYPIAKRLLDVSIAIVGVSLLAPVSVLVTIAIRLRMHEPALFKQERPGHRERPFTLLKFRTMRTAIDSQGCVLPDSERLTRLGGFLRGTSLDEIPQLWNVLRGDMSLVGPRPLLMQYLDRYNLEQARRHEVMPGITGWAQVNGRNALTWEQKLDLDVWYVDHQSFLLDVKIIWWTLLKTLRQDGISQPGHATMSESAGTDRMDRKSCESEDDRQASGQSIGVEVK
jgi:lipopolysaccharide/colanic/teichoic acid biosynthesis glycosyltransferase